MERARKTCQSGEFSGRVLPELFHTSPVQFIEFLKRDGNKFLNFYWNLAGEHVPEACRQDPFGLNYEFHDLGNGGLIALVHMPEPKEVGESYFCALVYRPTRRILLVTDTTRIINLEYDGEKEGKVITFASEVSKKIRKIELGPGPRPYPADFVDYVIEVIRTG